MYHTVYYHVLVVHWVGLGASLFCCSCPLEVGDYLCAIGCVARLVSIPLLGSCCMW